MEKAVKDQWLSLSKAKTFLRESDFAIGKFPNVHRAVLEKFYADYPLLPIEFLKDFPAELEAEFRLPPIHSFLSSGTTARDRSRSSFSAEGLLDYRDFSVRSFQALLEHFFESKIIPGISFIPSPTEWPTSSLAQMVAWIGEHHPLSYWSEELPTPTEPVWLFATGFHIVAFADGGGSFPLPPGSIVIETGGTKGKTRSVTREETYELIERCFRVDKNHIVSEYGMCELASQAYDFVKDPKGSIIGLSDRWFRFPAWAQTRVLDESQTIKKSGRGSLIVHDIARTDIQTPFRTEDQAFVREDGSFQLLGRVAFSPLKGCSLLAEDILKKNSTLNHQVPKSLISEPADAQDILDQRADTLHRLAQGMLKDPRFLELVRDSLKIDRVAEWWLSDLRMSLPKTPRDWTSSAENTKNQSTSWLFIPPRTHDFALMHPLFLAALLDLKVVVREASDGKLLKYWQDLFQGFWSFAVLNSDWRLEEGSPLPAESILVFGSDETIEVLKSATSHPVQGFGSWITLSIIHKSSWEDKAWMKDAFSLRQEGCMSTRLLFVWDEDAPEALPEITVDLGALPLPEQLQLAHSELDLALRGFEVLPRPNKNAPVLGHKKRENGTTIADLLSPRPLTLPVIRSSKNEVLALMREIEMTPTIKLLTLDEKSKEQLSVAKNVLIRPLGQGNTSPWTGWHGPVPLFFPKDSR